MGITHAASYYRETVSQQFRSTLQAVERLSTAHPETGLSVADLSVFAHRHHLECKETGNRSVSNLAVAICADVASTAFTHSDVVGLGDDYNQPTSEMKKETSKARNDRVNAEPYYIKPHLDCNDPFVPEECWDGLYRNRRTRMWMYSLIGRIANFGNTALSTRWHSFVLDYQTSPIRMYRRTHVQMGVMNTKSVDLNAVEGIVDEDGVPAVVPPNQRLAVVDVATFLSQACGINLNPVFGDVQAGDTDDMELSVSSAPVEIWLEWLPFHEDDLDPSKDDKEGSVRKSLGPGCVPPERSLNEMKETVAFLTCRHEGRLVSKTNIMANRQVQVGGDATQWIPLVIDIGDRLHVVINVTSIGRCLNPETALERIHLKPTIEVSLFESKPAFTLISKPDEADQAVVEMVTLAAKSRCYRFASVVTIDSDWLLNMQWTAIALRRAGLSMELFTRFQPCGLRGKVAGPDDIMYDMTRMAMFPETRNWLLLIFGEHDYSHGLKGIGYGSVETTVTNWGSDADTMFTFPFLLNMDEPERLQVSEDVCRAFVCAIVQTRRKTNKKMNAGFEDKLGDLSWPQWLERAIYGLVSASRGFVHLRDLQLASASTKVMASEMFQEDEYDVVDVGTCNSMEED